MVVGVVEWGEKEGGAGYTQILWHGTHNLKLFEHSERPQEAALSGATPFRNRQKTSREATITSHEAIGHA